MRQHRKNEKGKFMPINYALSYLPDRIRDALLRTRSELLDSLCEIRLRCNLPMSLTTLRGNVFINSQGKIVKINDGIVTTAAETELAVNRLSEGSVYRYMNTISEGYIVTRHGIRAGICGECISDGVVQNFTSVNIRLPRFFENTADAAARRFLEKGESILIFSPPGEGKTTYIRSLAITLSCGRLGAAKRVAVIDERGEILPPISKIYGSAGIIDRLTGYAKPKGMEIATRVLSPEVIICDEIGLSDDLDAILSVQNSGVPLIATTHGRDADSISCRPIIKKLLDRGVFDCLAELKRNGNSVNAVFHQL